MDDKVLKGKGDSKFDCMENIWNKECKFDLRANKYHLPIYLLWRFSWHKNKPDLRARNLRYRPMQIGLSIVHVLFHS